jgi:predicted permease
VSAIIFGIVPALTSSREAPIGILRAHGRAGASGPRNIFLSVQVALSLVLLVAASLFARSLQAGLQTNLGFDPRPLALVSVDVMRHGYTRQRSEAYYDAALARARAVPGVSAVAIADHVPLGPVVRLPFTVAGAAPQTAIRAGLNSITPDYFDVVGTRLVEGRKFTASDNRSVPNVAIVNEAAARLLAPGQSIVGRELRLMSSIPVHVVGVVRNTKYESVRDDGVPVVFMPLVQQPTLTPAKIVIRSADPHQSLPELRRQIAALDPDVPVLDARLVVDQLDVALMPQRFGATLLGLFAFIALGVTAGGVYGVAAYGVNRRLGEIGIRIALGARRSHIVHTVFGRSGNAVLVGAIAGSVGAALISRALQRFLFAITPRDPVSFAAAAVVTAVAAVVACWLPARRAMSVDPMDVIRG